MTRKEKIREVEKMYSLYEQVSAEAFANISAILVAHASPHGEINMPLGGKWVFVNPTNKQWYSKQELRDIISIIEGWLVDEFTEETSWTCPKCHQYVGEGKYCTNDRSKPLKKVRKWADTYQSARNQLREELRTKLLNMKENDAS